MKTFYALMEETCQACNENGEMRNPEHDRQLAFQEKWNEENPQPEGDDTATWQAHYVKQDDALWEYLSGEDYFNEGPAPLITCEHCNGTKIITTRISLEDALRLSVQA